VKFRSARELIRALATAAPEEQRRIIWSMTPADLLALDADFESWAHRNQLPPPDQGWRNWLMMAGRGFGKTRAGAEWIEGLARSRPGVRMALIGATIDEARRVMVEGVSGVLSVAARNGSRVEWEPSLGRLTWRNGSEAQIFSGDNADGLRGPEHDFAWVFTFEVESDPSPPTITAILADASGGKIAASDQRNVVGYAAYGDAIQPAVQPFVDHFGIQLFDDGQSLRAPTSASFDCLDTELGCSADLQPQPRAARSQVAARSLPTALTVEYYDPARDFQAAQSRASIPSALAKTATEQLPAALDCGFARALTETALARQWAERDTLRLRLPPPYLTLEPGMFLKRPNDTAYWTVSRTETDGMAVIADLHSRYGSFESMASDPGRVLSSPDVEVQPTQLAILELPDIDGTAGDAPQLSIAASSAAGAWKPVAVQIDTSGISQISQTAALPTILGVADTVLGDGQSILFDERSSVDVQLTSHEHWLQSCDDDALVNGGNLAAVGTELIQFGKVETLGAGKFRLSRLLRGRRGTEWAMGTHGAGETFAMIDPTRLQPVPVPVSAIGSDLSATALGLGDDAAVPVVHTVSGEALKPPSPVHLTAEFDSAGNLNCSWCRRSRSGWAWIDNVDAPLGCSSELYTVQLQGSASRLELQTNVASATFRAADITTIGSGMVLNVTQVGDFAVSRPATIQINS